MTFNPAIPQPNDLLTISQPQILANFSQSNTIFGSDHVEFDNATVANRGKHTNIRFIEQAGDPTTLVNEIGLYAKDVGGTPRLFVREESNGTVYQLNAGTPLNANPGHSWLPGGLLIKWGSFTTAANVLQTLTYAIGAGIPAFSAAPYSIQLSVEGAAGAGRVFVNVRTGTNTATGVQINTVDQNNNNIGARTLYWTAIGPS